MISVRSEEERDITAVRALNEEAFGQSTEADIVDTLRHACPEGLSLVAADEERVLGHIRFSPVTVEDPVSPVMGMGLAPMAVLPHYQRQGIGTILVETGLKILRDRSCPFVVVLGHPAYYPRFGFEPASRRGIRSQWDEVPDDAFLIVVFDKDTMKGVSGVARYRKEFDEEI